MGYRVLMLIDHIAHHETNSVYSLARAFKAHKAVKRVFVASRSSPDNQDFFLNFVSLSLSAIEVTEQFNYDHTGQQFSRSLQAISLPDFDLVIMRLPHPISLAFFNFLSSHFPPEQIINRPDAILTTGSKEFLLQLQEWCPPVYWCKSLEDVIMFHQHFDLVLKPLKNYGGKGIFKVEHGHLVSLLGVQSALESSGHLLTDLENEGYLAMKFLKNVYLGDKRIVVANGKIMGASLRTPPPGSWLCNVSQGGISIGSQADERERAMTEKVHELMAPLGIGMFGVDTLVDDDGQRVLSEINTLSVGGVGPMEIQHQRPISFQVVEELLQFYEQSKR